MSLEDFDIDSLAAYLHLTPKQVMRMADRDRLPGRKTAGEWRFPRIEIHHWLEERIGGGDEDHLADVEGVLARTADKGELHLAIRELLPKEAISIPLAARTRGSVISSMCEMAADTGLLWDPEKMATSVQNREDMFSTAMDNGIALLHPRRPQTSILGEPFIAFGRTYQGIPFGASSGGLTDIFFLICSMDDRWHLRVLAKISRLLKEPSVLESVRRADNADTLLQILEECEDDLD